MATPVLINPPRNIGGFIADAVLEERHEDTLTVTRHPVEVGSSITDHAFKEPAELQLEYVWAAASPQNAGQDFSFLKTIYQNLLNLQSNRVLLQVVTGKRTYNNMILRRISVNTDLRSENILWVRAQLEEVILVSTQVVSLGEAQNLAIPTRTQFITNQGSNGLVPASNFNGPIVP